MKTILATVLAGGFTFALAAAAHAQSAQIPTPANPFPTYAIATNGTPLPSQSDAFRSGGFEGRSVAAPAPFGFVGDVAGAGLGAAGAVVGTGVGVANGVAGAGLGAVGVR